MQQTEAWMRSQFYFKFKGVIKCSQCHSRRESSDSKSTSLLQISVPTATRHSRAFDLQKRVNAYFQEDDIQDWLCDNCGSKQDALRKFKLENMPGRYLFVQLNRFDFTVVGSRENARCQIASHLYLPSETLRSGVPFKLLGWINHDDYGFGRLETGHYTTSFYQQGPSTSIVHVDDHNMTSTTTNF